MKEKLNLNHKIIETKIPNSIEELYSKTINTNNILEEFPIDKVYLNGIYKEVHEEIKKNSQIETNDEKNSPEFDDFFLTFVKHKFKNLSIEDRKETIKYSSQIKIEPTKDFFRKEIKIIKISGITVLVVPDHIYQIIFHPNLLGVCIRFKDLTYIVLPEKNLFKNQKTYEVIKHEVLHIIQYKNQQKNQIDNVNLSYLEVELVSSFKEEIEAYFINFYYQKKEFTRKIPKKNVELQKSMLFNTSLNKDEVSKEVDQKLNEIMKYFSNFVDLMSMNDFIDLIKNENFRNAQSLDDLILILKDSYFKLSLSKLRN